MEIFIILVTAAWLYQFGAKGNFGIQILVIYFSCNMICSFMLILILYFLHHSRVIYSSFFLINYDGVPRVLMFELFISRLWLLHRLLLNGYALGFILFRFLCGISQLKTNSYHILCTISVWSVTCVMSLRCEGFHLEWYKGVNQVGALWDHSKFWGKWSRVN